VSTLITEECINCGACARECPNNAIYEGGKNWELNGVEHSPLREDVYYIVPDKCTECVGFFEQEQCAAVCPVDCCIPDPDIPEEEAALIERACRLHPDQRLAEPIPSRFRRG
jgi:ferredoxin